MQKYVKRSFALLDWSESERERLLTTPAEGRPEPTGAADWAEKSFLANSLRIGLQPQETCKQGHLAGEKSQRHFLTEVPAAQTAKWRDRESLGS